MSPSRHSFGGIIARWRRRLAQVPDDVSPAAGSADTERAALPPKSRRETVITHVNLVRTDASLAARITEADAARDRRDWELAVVGYETVLAQVPFHAGYMVQFAHCLKEMRQMEEAELCYRDALALGAPSRDVLEHLAFCAWQSGWRGLCYPDDLLLQLQYDVVEPVGHRVFDLQFVTSGDVVAVLRGFFDNPDLSTHAVLSWMRRATRLDDLLAAVIASDAFLHDNRPLVRLASEAAGAGLCR